MSVEICVWLFRGLCYERQVVGMTGRVHLGRGGDDRAEMGRGRDDVIPYYSTLVLGE